MQTGKLSIDSDNIFPIIKKWLYNEKDIFVRELVSNGSDAITKLKKLKDLGEWESDEKDDSYKIEIELDKDAGTIKFIDNGIGMTEEEIDKYINQIAFSGAKEFMEQHENDTDSSIIGHFGLGFYSCFMAAEKVEIDSLSYVDGSKAVHWESNGNADFKIKASQRKKRGTEITLTCNDEGKEFIDKYRMINVLEKYCSYMPYKVLVYDKGCKEEEKKVINDIPPVWMKDPKECTDDDYIAFYHSNFEDINNPLFWIHLNMDYPVKLKGVLYFPKFTHEYELNEGKVKLYCNQVYVADNIKEVIPDFLLVLKGAIDCPELPLNVSRSFLQSDEYVKKISSYIIKKVADKLKEEKKKDETKYQELWDTLSTFIKFGCIRNDSFYDKVKDCLLFKNIDEKYTTLNDYVANITDDKYQKTIYYVSDTAREASYIKMFKEAGLDAVILNSGIDVHFIAYLEQREHTLKFERIDSGLNEAALSKENVNEEEMKTLSENLSEMFKKFIPEIKDFTVKAESFKSNEIAGMIIMPESSRRMKDIFEIYGKANPFGDMPVEKSFVLNSNNNLVKFLNEGKDKVTDDIDSEENKKYNLVCNQLYDLARINSEGLNEKEMNDFIKRSQDIMNLLVK